MGQHQCGRLFPRYGCCVPSQHPNACHENHARVRPATVRRQRSDLSAAFSYAGAGRPVGASRSADLLNINTATEEALMTLSGINRQTAANIVNYRRQIGAFRRVEDLALVSGIGATRLEDLRCEICVMDRFRSHSGSSTSSGVDLDNEMSSGNGSCRSAGSKFKVNVNTANIFQLMKVRGITQAVAENIVTYRKVKGPFTSLDDLVRVKGVKPPLLSLLRPYLVLRDSSHLNGGVESVKVGKLGKALVNNPLEFVSNRSGWSLEKLPEKSVLRLATWSLEKCGLEKVENPGVKEVIAMTILENGLKIVAMQDVSCGLVLQKLCDALNEPTLHNVKSWPGPRGRWKCVVPPSENSSSEVVGFIYDASHGVKVRNGSWLKYCFSPERKLTAMCFTADFVVDGVVFSLVNFRISSASVEATESGTWKDLVQHLQKSKTGNSLIFAGEFGASSSSQVEIMEAFEEAGYRALISRNVFTDISTNNQLGSNCSENFWLSPRASAYFHGFSGVLRDGLTSPWIPDGWRWGGLVSSHCPVITDLMLNNSCIKTTQTRE